MTSTKASSRAVVSHGAGKIETPPAKLLEGVEAGPRHLNTSAGTQGCLDGLGKLGRADLINVETIPTRDARSVIWGSVSLAG